jgi:hypothetical protein
LEILDSELKELDRLLEERLIELLDSELKLRLLDERLRELLDSELKELDIELLENGGAWKAKLLCGSSTFIYQAAGEATVAVYWMAIP